MSINHLTRMRLGALMLIIFTLAFFAYPFIAKSFFDRTDLILVTAMALFPFGIMTLYACMADGRGGGWALAALILLLLAIAPLQIFASVGAFALFPARYVFYQTGNQDVLRLVAMIMSYPRTPMGFYSVIILGGVLLVLGTIVLAVAIWRSKALPKPAGILFALGFALFAVSFVVSQAFFSKIVSIASALCGTAGGLWLAWAVWLPISQTELEEEILEEVEEESLEEAKAEPEIESDTESMPKD